MWERAVSSTVKHFMVTGHHLFPAFRSLLHLMQLPRKKPAKEKDPVEVYRDAKREDLNAAIFNLREIESKFSFKTKQKNAVTSEIFDFL